MELTIETTTESSVTAPSKIVEVGDGAPSATIKLTANGRPYRHGARGRFTKLETTVARKVSKRPDGRTAAALLFDELIGGIQKDLGGADLLSTIERGLVEGFAGAFVILRRLNARLASGEAIDPAEHAQTVSEMVRVATRVGTARRARVVGSGLGDLMCADLEKQRLREQAQRQEQERAD
jgi:hypothetical protein